jgi:ribose 5-phosphate isomerase B
MEKTILVASDHAGYQLKESLKTMLKKMGWTVKDLGSASEDPADYPEYANRLCREILSGSCKKGILVCGTGLGMSYAANRHKGIRAALCTNKTLARMAASHNNANVLCLGGRLTPDDLAFEITRIWLETPYEGGRHQRRIEMLDPEDRAN